MTDATGEMTIYVRHARSDQFENAGVVDGSCVWSFLTQQGRHETFEENIYAGESEENLVAWGFTRAPRAVTWSWETEYTGSGPVDSHGHWVGN